MLLSPGALVKSVNSNINVTEKVKARTVVLLLQCLLINIMSL